MNDCIYNKISATVKNGNNNTKYDFDYVISFEEYDHEIVIESAVQIDSLIRGYVGDLFYHANGFEFNDNKKKVTTVTCFKDVLLARITVSAQSGCPIVWKYNFLKD